MKLKLHNFEAELGDGRMAVYDGDVLVVRGVKPEEALALAQHLSLFWQTQPVPEVPPPAAELKAPPAGVETPARVAKGKAYRARKNGAAGRPEVVDAELVPSAPPILELVSDTDITGGPSGGHAERLDKPPEDPFVADAPDTVARDEVSRAVHLGETPPDDLTRAKSLRDIGVYFVEQRGVATRAELLRCCEAWREQIPLLSRMTNLPDRVDGVSEMLGLPQ